MRPTNLSFRSPKERTPDAYFPQVTSDGRFLSFSPRQARGGAIGHEQRFKEYSLHSRKTGYRVGPGSYHPESDKATPCALVYRPLSKENTSNAYMMVGNHLVFDGFLMAAKRRKEVGMTDPALRVDMEFALSQTEAGPMRSAGSETLPRPRTEGAAAPTGLEERMDYRQWGRVGPRRSFTRTKTIKKARTVLLSAREKRIRKALDERLSVPV